MTALYKPLRQQSGPSLLTSPNDRERDVDDQYNPPSKTSGWRGKSLLLTLFCSVSLNLLFLWRGSYYSAVATVDPIWGVQEPLYSPAQSAIKYERMVYQELGRKDKYFGPPTNATDEAWLELLPAGKVFRISEAEAAMLPNTTERIPNDEDHFVVSLDIFHQLHCLNNIRQALNPERYPPSPRRIEIFPGEPFDHIDHCINFIRESLMCHADVTPMVWHWEEWRQLSFPKFDTIHTCRNWDAIAQWSIDHALVVPWGRYHSCRLHSLTGIRLASMCLTVYCGSMRRCIVGCRASEVWKFFR